jgi:hypothetical protein
MGQQCSPGGLKARKHVTALQQRDFHVLSLDDVASVRDDELEHVTPDAERSELQPMHDSTAHPDEDDDSDPNLNCDACGMRRLRLQQHDRRMIAGECAGRHNRRDADGSLPSRCERNPARLHAQPAHGRPAAVSDHRPATEVESKARRSDRHRRGRVTRVYDRDRAAHRPAQPDANGRDGKCCRDAHRCGDHRPITVNVNVAV